MNTKIILVLVAVSIFSCSGHSFAVSKVKSKKDSGLKQLEVIGLVPGGSTKEEVREIGDGSFYTIEGYRLACTTDYSAGRLSLFVCPTGKNADSRDTKNLDKLVSNTEVYTVLYTSFRKKFGKPTKRIKETLVNEHGAEFYHNKVVWIDRKGNRLTLSDTVSKMTAMTEEGRLIIESARRVKDDGKSKK